MKKTKTYNSYIKWTLVNRVHAYHAWSRSGIVVVRDRTSGRGDSVSGSGVACTGRESSLTTGDEAARRLPHHNEWRASCVAPTGVNSRVVRRESVAGVSHVRRQFFGVARHAAVPAGCIDRGGGAPFSEGARLEGGSTGARSGGLAQGSHADSRRRLHRRCARDSASAPDPSENHPSKILSLATPSLRHRHHHHHPHVVFASFVRTAPRPITRAFSRHHAHTHPIVRSLVRPPVRPINPNATASILYTATTAVI